MAAQSPPVVVPVVHFALTPGKSSDTVLDYSTNEGIKIYRSSSAPLYYLEENRYDCTADGLKDILELLRLRAFKYGWDTSILTIPKDISAPNNDLLEMLDHHGTLTMEMITAHVQSYIRTHTRAAQDSMQLYDCVMGSLTKIGRDKITIWKELYVVGTPPLPSGALLLKIVIRESHIDTHATTAHIRTSLASLDVYMPTIGSDITKFNVYVMDLLSQLNARGETTHELLTFLFKGYKAAQDHVFVKCIEKKEEDYEEGTDIVPTTLMNLAANKYKTRVLKQAWMAPTPEEEKILALSAEVDKLKKQRSNPTPKGKDLDKGKDPGKGGKKERKKPSDDNPWMLVAPDDKTKPRQHNGKDW